MPEDALPICSLDLYLASQYPAASWSKSWPKQSLHAHAAFYTEPHQELRSLLSGAAVFALTERRLLAVDGADQERWLNGMVTNTIKDLAVGHSNYNYALNSQGKILGDLTAYRLPDRILLSVDAAQTHRLVEHFDYFIIMDDVALTPLTDRTAIGVAGPQAVSLLEKAGIPIPQGTQCFLDAADLAPHPVLVAQDYSPTEYGHIIPRFTLWVAECDAPALWDRLTAAGFAPVGAEALNALRILDGIPHYGLDFNDQHLPHEVDAVRPLHFRKGCYLGQEIVERIRSRAHVNRQLCVVELLDAASSELASAELLRPEPLLPELPLAVTVEPEQSQTAPGGAIVGEVTSLAFLPTQTSKRLIGLAMLRKEPVERQQPLICAGRRLSVLSVADLMQLRSEAVAS